MLPSDNPSGDTHISLKRTKVVCTLGPASVGRVGELIASGMDVARVNFSHGTDEDHRKTFEAIRSEAEKAGRIIGIVADLPGPKLRIGELPGGLIRLEPGGRFDLRTNGTAESAPGASVNHPGLSDDLRPGDRVLLADGAAELRVLETGTSVVTEVIKGGVVRSRAGVNVPSERLTLPAITGEDRRDLQRAVELGADFVAQSFVRTADDVRQLRTFLDDRSVKIIAKIETGAAVENAAEIFDVSDAIMLARGDLGVEIPYEEVPVVQKNLIRAATEAGVPAIVATQMLESMVNSPRPTRAEASDVANAVLDGTDGILLSAETAIGRFPVESARAATRIIEAAEARGVSHLWERRQPPPQSQAQALAQGAAWMVNRDPRLQAIVCFTQTGKTAELLSAVRPRVPVYTFSSDEAILRSLTLRGAIVPVTAAQPADTDSMIEMMDRHLQSEGGLSRGTPVLILASSPVGEGHTNLLKFHQVGL
jgi:pyruvate kinase